MIEKLAIEIKYAIRSSTKWQTKPDAGFILSCSEQKQEDIKGKTNEEVVTIEDNS